MLYKLVSCSYDKVFYGGTINTTRQRLQNHIELYRKYRNTGKGRYSPSFELFYNSECIHDIKLIKITSVKCEDKDHLNAKVWELVENDTSGKCLNLQAKHTHTDKCGCIDKATKTPLVKCRNEKTKPKRTDEKIRCECGADYTKSNKARHYKSKKHQKYINEQ